MSIGGTRNTGSRLVGPRGSGRRRRDAEIFAIPLIDACEAAEFALHAVEVTVMIGAAGLEAVAADAIAHFDARDDVNGKGQASDPGRAGGPVREIELRRRRVFERVSAPRLRRTVVSRCGLTPPTKSR